MPPAVRETLETADVVLSLNCRFGEMTTAVYTLFGTDGRPNDQQIVHMHPSVYEFGKVVTPVATVQAGPNAMAAALLAGAVPAGADRARWAGWRTGRRAAFEATLDCPPQLGDLDMG